MQDAPNWSFGFALIHLFFCPKSFLIIYFLVPYSLSLLSPPSTRNPSYTYKTKPNPPPLSIYKTMDKLLAVHQKKATKQPLHKTKKKPVKVVYISNPMKVKTSASEFRALVQELTGRHSGMPPESPDSGGQDHGFVREVKEEEHEHALEEEVPATGVQSGSDLGNRPDLYDRDVFMPQMMEKFSGFFPSSFWYESSHHLDRELKRLDAV